MKENKKTKATEIQAECQISLGKIQAGYTWAKKEESQGFSEINTEIFVCEKQKILGSYAFLNGYFGFKGDRKLVFKNKKLCQDNNLSQSYTSQILKGYLFDEEITILLSILTKLDKQGCFQNVSGSTYQIKYYPLFPFQIIVLFPQETTPKAEKEEEEKERF